MALPRQRRHDRLDHEFYSYSGERSIVEAEGQRWLTPVFYHRADLFQSLHLASYGAVRDLLPSSDLEPIRWFDGRAVIGIAAFRYHHVSVEAPDGTPQLLAPYGEISINALVARHPTRRGISVLRSTVVGPAGFIFHLPVTTAEACKAGRDAFGMAKFVADMDFYEEPTLRRVTLSEEGAEILSLQVARRGPVIADHSPITAYSVLAHQLIETRIPFSGFRQTAIGSQAGRLTLGSHLVADQLRTLAVAPAALMSASYLDARLILPLGTPVAECDAYTGYPGRPRDRGRYTLAYPHTGPMDLYTVPAGIWHQGEAAATTSGGTPHA